MKKREDLLYYERRWIPMTEYEKYDLLDNLNYQLEKIIFSKYENHQGNDLSTFSRYVLMYPGNIKLSGIDLRHAPESVCNRNAWYLW